MRRAHQADALLVDTRSEVHPTFKFQARRVVKGVLTQMFAFSQQRFIHLLLLNLMLAIAYPSVAAVKFFGETLCHTAGYRCHTVSREDSWSSLFSSDKARDLVKRVNRQNGFLSEGMILAIPNHLSKLSLFDVSPFPRYRRGIHEKYILLNLKQQAYAAYDATGELVLWGPISSGAALCLEQSQGCHTPRGAFRIVHKEGADCVSKTYPLKLDGQKGGGGMSYCMYFHKGYALHASEDLPGYAASHGCIRLFSEDARFLNEHFVTAGRNSGTRVFID